jgi:hypothetical protein
MDVKSEMPETLTAPVCILRLLWHMAESDGYEMMLKSPYNYELFFPFLPVPSC